MIEGALRFNEGKLRFDLLPPDPVEELVAVLTMGAKSTQSGTGKRA